jgi:hypothetical protein
VPIRGVNQRPLITAVALAALLALAGCSAPPTPSGGTGGDGGSGGTNGRPGTSEGEPGAADPEEPTTDDVAPVSGRLPDDWPADVVVPDGEIVQAMSLGGTWIALVNVADTAGAFASSSASLQAAGYAVVSEVATDHGSIGVYESAQLQVQIAIATAPEAGWTMSYTITEKS